MFSLNYKLVDTIIIAVATIIAALFVVIGNVFLNPRITNTAKVIININNKNEYNYSLFTDRIITLKKEDHPVLLGEMVIEIKDKKVAVVKEKSPQNLCSKQGFVSTPARPIICAPNKVIVKIIATSNNDDSDWILG